MKIRKAFVSNSSSSSFVISKTDITAKQVEQILDYENICEEILGEESCDSWNITDEKHSVEGYTTMDNGDMKKFLGKIGVRNIIEWDEE